MEEHTYVHGGDPDGIGSGAIMKRYMKKRRGLDGKINFLYHSSSELADMFKEMMDFPEGSSVIFIDFRADERYVSLIEEAFNSRQYKIRLIDHHKWDDVLLERIKHVADVVLSDSLEFCGAELAYMEYMKGDEVSEALARIGRDSDIEAWKHRPPKPKYVLTFPLADLITYYNYLSGDDRQARTKLLNGLVDKLSSASVGDLLNEDFEKPLWDEGMEADYKRYSSLKKEKLKECMRNAETYDIGIYRVAISRSSDILSTSTSANHLLENFDVDFSMVLYGNGSFTVRRKTEGVRCDEIAGLFKGGGHKYAAGASVGFPIRDKDDFEKAKRLIIGRISKLRFFL